MDEETVSVAEDISRNLYVDDKDIFCYKKSTCEEGVYNVGKGIFIPSKKEIDYITVGNPVKIDTGKKSKEIKGE